MATRRPSAGLRLTAIAFAILLSSAASAQINTTFSTAATLAVGYPAFSHVGPGATQFWFVFGSTPGRSYCVETAHDGGHSEYTQAFVDTTLKLLAANGITVLGENDDAFEEPSMDNLSRLCFVAPADNNAVFVKLAPFVPFLAVSQPVEIRVVETTLFCPWFFIAGDYNAFSLIRNTSGTPLNGVVVTWRGLNGTIAGTTTVSIAPNGGVILNARDFVNPGAFSNGTVEIAYPGALDQLQGSTTTLSGTTGLGFDAKFETRRPW